MVMLPSANHIMCTTSDRYFCQWNSEQLGGMKANMWEQESNHPIATPIVQYNRTFTSEYHICTWLFPDEWRRGWYSGSEIKKHGKSGCFKMVDKSVVVGRRDDNKESKSNKGHHYFFQNISQAHVRTEARIRQILEGKMCQGAKSYAWNNRVNILSFHLIR